MNCLDSSFIIDFLDPEKKHHKQAVEWMKENKDDKLATTPICAFEVLRGAVRIQQNRKQVESFLMGLIIPGFGFEEAVTAAETDAELHSKGDPLSARDTLIASQARRHNYTLITRDDDFNNVPGLDVVIYSE